MAIIDDPSAYFQNIIWTGNATDDRALTFDGNSNLQPDFTWIKCRSNATNHQLIDSVRGVTKQLNSNLDAAETTETIRAFYAEHDILIDPHTAVGLAAARAKHEKDGVPMVILSTAHPAKFPDAVKGATGVHPPLPERMTDLYDREERSALIENDIAAMQSFIEKTKVTSEGTA